jgi:hypothetical protein
MPISSKIDLDNDIKIFAATGKLTFDEAMLEVKKFYHHPIKNVMWDLRNVSDLKFSTEEVVELAGFDQRSESSSRINGKTAIVASQDLIYGLGRMFQSLSEFNAVPFTVMIFRSMEEAQEWIEDE